MKITGYTRSKGRFCQSAISSSTRSVIFEIVSREMFVEYTSARWASTSPVVNPFAVERDHHRVDPVEAALVLATVSGSKLPSRSRGTSSSMGPISVITVFDRVPLRELP